MTNSENIEQKELDLITLKDMKGWHFVIPFEQRGYRWRIQNVLELVLDFMEFVDPDNQSTVYCMQPLALEMIDKKNRRFQVWDGQQRLTTLYLLYMALGLTPPYSFSLARDTGSNQKREDFLNNPTYIYESEDDIDTFYMKRAYKTFLACCEFKDEIPEDLSLHHIEKETYKLILKKDKSLIGKVKQLLNNELEGKEIEFIKYLVPSDKAIEIFHNLNSGKIALTNSELIKSLILSDSSKIKNKELAAVQFGEMEQILMDDRFWFMMQPYEVVRRFGRIDEVEKLSDYVDIRSKLRRIDMLFNITAGISFTEYKNDPIASFRYFFQNKEDITRLWNETRENLKIMLDLFNNIHYYHYIGFLTYCSRRGDRYHMIKDILKKAKTKSKTVFLKELKDEISCQIEDDIINLRFENKQKEKIRRILLLHNILTILKQFEKQNMDKQLKLQEPFEVFPFDLLYRQNWHIEHMASQTDNDLKKEEEQKEWIETSRKDYPLIFEIKEINSLKLEWYSETDRKKKKEKFDELYTRVVEEIDREMGNDKVKEKDGLGNLVLLDEHTNTSYHNSLYPQKRRCIISATIGGEEMKLAFVPICTRYAFTKFFNKKSDVKVTEWTQNDFDAYQGDIIKKVEEFKQSL